MPNFDHIAEKIIKEQEFIIGPLAWSEAGKVPGLSVDLEHREVRIVGSDHKAAIDSLVAQYEHLFGRASQEACRNAVATLIASMPAGDIPASLRV